MYFNRRWSSFSIIEKKTLLTAYLIYFFLSYAHRLKEPAMNLSTMASKRVPIQPKNENPIKSPKAPPSELNKSMLLNIRTSSLIILIFSVKLKKNIIPSQFSELKLVSSTLVEYVTKDFCFKQTLAFCMKRNVALSFSFDLLHKELKFFKIH